jgi:hypothetical protein
MRLTKSRWIWIGLAIAAALLVGGAYIAVTLSKTPDEPPGAGAKANAGYMRAYPIIKALAQYHDDYGTYPDDLQALTPDYLKSEELEVWQNGDGRYKAVAGSYQLSFSYIGPGMNSCTYEPVLADWSCSGAY